MFFHDKIPVFPLILTVTDELDFRQDFIVAESSDDAILIALFIFMKNEMPKFFVPGIGIFFQLLFAISLAFCKEKLFPSPPNLFRHYWNDKKSAEKPIGPRTFVIKSHCNFIHYEPVIHVLIKRSKST